MGGSLVVAGYDLLASSSPAQLSARDLGDGVPDTETVARILLDGDVVSGDRTGNRTLALTVFVRTGSRSGDAAVVSALFAAVNQRQWSIVWTPDDGMPAVVFDCFRGALTQDWSYKSTDRFVTLTVPCMPFTRDAAATVLEPPAVPPDPVVLDAMDSASGLGLLPAVIVSPNELAQVDVNSFVRYVARDPAVGGDAIKATASVDTATKVSGTGSVRIRQPMAVISVADPHATDDVSRYGFTPFTVSRDLGAATDLSDGAVLTWWARTNVSWPSLLPAVAGADPAQVGIDPAWQDNPAATSGEIAQGVWTVTLTDAAGKISTWVGQQPVPTGTWAQYRQNLTVGAAYADSGFDITQVSAYRLRCYLGMQNPSGVTGTSPELYSTPRPAGEANLLNCTAIVWYGTDVAGVADWFIQVLSSGGAGDLEVSRSDTVPVTAGSVYSGRCGMRERLDQPDYAWNGATFQCGIEWLNSSGTVLSTSWGAVTSPIEDPHLDPGDLDREPSGLVEPIVEDVTAPAGATQARIRWRMIPGAETTPAFKADAARIVAGATAWRYPYNDTSGWYHADPVQTATMWFDRLQAEPQPAGMALTTAYGIATFPDVDGVARCPISLQLTATTGTPAAVLLARTPDPAARFNPFLDSPTTSTTPDAAALSGHYSTGTATYAVPANGYGSTYALLARVSGAGSIAVTAALTGDTDNTEGTPTVTLPTSSGYQWAPVGALTLPPRGVDPTNAAQTITLTATLGGSALLDMIVLVDLAGEFVMVDGVTATQFWLDSPDTDQFTGTLYAGDSDDRTDAVSCGPFQTGNAVLHFQPGRNALTVVTDGATASQTILTYSPRWPGERPT